MRSGLILKLSMLRRANGLNSGRCVGMAFAIVSEDLEAGVLGEAEGFADGFDRDPVRLGVHLDRRDAVLGAGDLKSMPPVPSSRSWVREDTVAALFAVAREADGDAGDGRLERDAGVEEGPGRAAGRAHRGRTVRAEDFGDDADGVGKVVGSGSTGMSARSARGAVADLAARRGRGWAGLAHAIAREVVVVEIPLLGLVLHGVQGLLHAGRAERHRGEDLGRPAVEEAGTVVRGMMATSAPRVRSR